MPDLVFDLPALFEQTFGYRTRAFQPEFSEVKGSKGDRTEQGSQGAPYYGVDAAGKEYFLPVTISFGIDSDGSNSTGSISRYMLPYPVVSISAEKHIIETQLTERRGTVKELVNTTDYTIKVKGFVIGADNEFPEAEVEMLRNLYEQNQPLSLECPLTDIFLLRPDRSGSDMVVITDLKLLSVTGVKNVRPYELTFRSDEPFNLISVK